MANYSLVQRQRVVITDADAGNVKDFLLAAAVKPGSAYVMSSVMENRAGNARGALAWLFDATHVRVEWPGALAGGESITVSFEVYDSDDLGDSLQELLFRVERVLGVMGENCVQDKLIVDGAGNIVSYRLRLFDSEANAAAAVLGADAWPAVGERARIAVSQQVDKGKNDRTSLLRTRTHVIATPGVS